ncbi:MAG: vitamin K epoxide reductase family protein [Chloroflexota bacterium]
MLKKLSKIFLAIILSLFIVFGLSAAVGVQAAAPSDQPVVRAVLFYSPSCGHCEYVRTDIFPPLIDKYGSQLEIAEINISTEAGYKVFDIALKQYQVPETSQGVPFLLIEDQYLVGSIEIPEQFPQIIASELQADGTTWPQIPEVLEFLEIIEQPDEILAEATPSEAAPELTIVQQDDEPETPLFILRYQQDLAGNTIAVIVLVGMIIAMTYTGIVFMRTASLRHWPEWITPLLLVIGFGVAVYLSTIEVYGGEAICGPVGDCNAVQASPYSRLFGLIHIGVIGMIGYVMIGIAWALGRWGKESYRSMAHMAVFLFTVFGTMFSIYLTFLEPFVIGATCMWCITSAVVMSLLMLIATPVALDSWMIYEDEDEEFGDEE